RPNFKKLDLDYCSKVLTVWDFLVSFKQTLNIDINYNFEDLYNYIQLKNRAILSQIYYTLILSLGKSLNNLDEIEEKDLLFVKILAYNINTDVKTIYKRSWIEIMKVILYSKKFSLMITK